MSFQQSLVDALLLSASASAAAAAASSSATAKTDATARPSGSGSCYGNKLASDSVHNGNDYDPCYDSIRRILPPKPARGSSPSLTSTSSSPVSMGPLAPRLIVDLSFLASSPSSSPKKPSSSPRRLASKPIDDDDDNNHNDDEEDRGRRRAASRTKRREERRSRSHVRYRMRGGADTSNSSNVSNNNGTSPRSNGPGAARRTHSAITTLHEEPADSSSSSSSHGSTTSTAATAELSASASTTTDDDSAATTGDPPVGPRRRHRSRRRTKVRFALDANDHIIEEAFECPYDIPLTDEERALCYVTRRETQANKRAAVVFAREHALRHVDHVHLLEQLFGTPLKCDGGGRGGDGAPSRESEDLLVESADAVLRWVHPKAVSSGGDRTATLGDTENDAMAMELLLQRIGNSEARGLEPFVAPLLRKHQRWAIRTVLERHRQLTRTMTTQQRGGGGHGSSSSATQCRRDGDGDGDEALLRLRRCCELVNACTRDLARLLAEADAREAQKI
jgi:hypothetical protein